MDEKEFFYIDRPSVPATQQNLIDPDKLMEHAIPIDPSSINPDTLLFASEVKDSNGTVVGTILYAPYVTYSDTVGPGADSLTDNGEVEEEVEYGLDEEADEEVIGHSDDAASYPDVMPEVADLELELAEAKQVVQDIENEIRALQQDESGC